MLAQGDIAKTRGRSGMISTVVDLGLGNPGGSAQKQAHGGGLDTEWYYELRVLLTYLIRWRAFRGCRSAYAAV